MSDYPRDLLIKENIIRGAEEALGIRIVNKSKSAEALKQHDAEVRRKTIEEFAQKVYDLFNKNNGKISLIDFDNLYKQMKGETNG